MSYLGRYVGLPRWCSGKKSTCQYHGQRRLVGSMGSQRDRTGCLSTHTQGRYAQLTLKNILIKPYY